MKEFVEYIVKNLVDNTENVNVESFEGERGVIIEVKVDSEDIGKIIGKKGSTIRSIRDIVYVVASRLGKKAKLEILEN